MKTGIIKIAILSISLAFASCGENSDNVNDHDNADDQVHSHAEAQAPSEVTSEKSLNDKKSIIKLVNNEKWKANPETTDGIKGMKMVIKKYTQKSSSEPLYSNLSKDLIYQFEEIFKNCTMKGEAHDQLHNYLYPMKDYFKKIESGDPKVAKQATSDLDQYLDTYNEFFE